MLFLEETKHEIGGDAVIEELDKIFTESGFEEITSFSGDEAGAIEICLEMETAWNALNQEMMSVEHSSIVNEDVEILNEGLKEFWKKVKDFFVKAWNGIKNFFNKVIDKLTGLFQNAEKWWDKNNKDIKPSASVKIETLPVVAQGKVVSSAKEGAQLAMSVKLSEAAEPEANKATLKKLEQGYEDLKKRLEATDEFEMKKDAVGSNLKGSTAAVAQLKAIQKAGAAAAQVGIKTAQANASVTDGAKQTKAKKNVEAFKKALSIDQKIGSLAIRSFKKGISDSLKAGKMLLRESK